MKNQEIRAAALQAAATLNPGSSLDDVLKSADSLALYIMGQGSLFISAQDLAERARFATSRECLAQIGSTAELFGFMDAEVTLEGNRGSLRDCLNFYWSQIPSETDTAQTGAVNRETIRTDMGL